MITLGSWSRPLPIDLNDADFDEHTTSASVAARNAEVTDMTFLLIVSQLSACTHRINFLEDEQSVNTWQHRLEMARSNSSMIEEKYLRHCDPTVDFHRLILKTARITMATMTLRAIRPIQRDPSNVLPPIDSPWVFELGVDALRQCCNIWNDTALMKWKLLAWVQWHTLAVVLAGLCSLTGKVEP